MKNHYNPHDSTKQARFSKSGALKQYDTNFEQIH